MSANRGSRTASPFPKAVAEAQVAERKQDDKEVLESPVASDIADDKDWNKFIPIGVAAFAVVVALVMRLCGPSHISDKLTLEAAATWAFICLETDVVNFAVPAGYFRWTVPAGKDESAIVRAILSAMLSGVAIISLQMRRQGNLDDFAFLWGTTVASYALVLVCRDRPIWIRFLVTCAIAALTVLTIKRSWYFEAVQIAVGLGAAMLTEWLSCFVSARRMLDPPYKQRVMVRMMVVATSFCTGLMFLTPLVAQLTKLLLPIEEIADVYAVMVTFVGAPRLRRMTEELLIVTTYCQVALGYLGIAFLKWNQGRKNNLVLIEHKKFTAKGYAWNVVSFMCLGALPYVIQRTLVENINGYVHGYYVNEVARTVRIGSMFPPTTSGLGDTLLASVQGSKHTVGGYTDSFLNIVNTAYGTIERKLFAIPKLLLLPGMLIKQPSLVVTVLPATVLLDIGRSRLIGILTKTIERISRELQELGQKRLKIEQHDTKHEELIRRSALSKFTEEQWRDMSAKAQMQLLRYDALVSFRAFINGLYRQDFLTPCYELLLAFLLEMGHITSREIWVYLRVIEDTIDFFLTRPRMDAQLASMNTHLDRMYDLSKRLEDTRSRPRASCVVEPQRRSIDIRGLRYSRGPVDIQIPELALRSGRVYAVTGANGSGKSSLFGIIASCGKQATMLPEGLNVLALDSLVLPSDDVVEITQHLYCSLFTSPLSWLLRRRDVSKLSKDELSKSEELIRKLSVVLQFHSSEDAVRSTSHSSSSSDKAVSEAPLGGIAPEELHAEVDDWYGTLSGGQRGKAEFMRQVFMKDQCPGILIIDEAFAPLDPKSKMLVQRKLKEFCAESLVLVIYHSDAHDSCVTAGGFFDDNLHFSNGTVSLKGLCQEQGLKAD